MNHMPGFIAFLDKLNRDTNNNVILVSLKLMNKVFQEDVQVLQKVNIEDLLPSFIQKVGDTNTSIRIETIQIFNTLNEKLSAKKYVNLICPYLTMSSLVFKEELLNVLQFAIQSDKIKSLSS